MGVIKLAALLLTVFGALLVFAGLSLGSFLAFGGVAAAVVASVGLVVVGGTCVALGLTTDFEE